MKFATCITMTAALFATACGDVALDGQSSALLTTEFKDAVAVSTQGVDDGLIISELRTLSGEIVATASVPPNSEEGKLSLLGAKPVAFKVGTPLALELVHQALHQSWRASVVAGQAGEVDYGSTCTVGGVPVTCGKKYCVYPNSKYYGGIPGAYCMTKSACRKLAASCGSNQVYWHNWWHGSACYGYCAWLVPTIGTCTVKVNGKVVKKVKAANRKDCYKKTSFGSRNCKVYAKYFKKGSNLLEQYFNGWDRVNSDKCVVP